MKNYDNIFNKNLDWQLANNHELTNINHDFYKAKCKDILSSFLGMNEFS